MTSSKTSKLKSIDAHVPELSTVWHVQQTKTSKSTFRSSPYPHSTHVVGLEMPNFFAIFLDRIKASSSLTIAGARTGIRSHGIITSEIFIIITVRVSSASLISISFIPHTTTRGSYIHCPAGLRAIGALLSSNNLGRIHF